MHSAARAKHDEQSTLIAEETHQQHRRSSRAHRRRSRVHRDRCRISPPRNLFLRQRKLSPDSVFGSRHWHRHSAHVVRLPTFRRLVLSPHHNTTQTRTHTLRIKAFQIRARMTCQAPSTIHNPKPQQTSPNHNQTQWRTRSTPPSRIKETKKHPHPGHPS
jgi:hypothetical protein